ncbi:hypothetical protein V5O48_007240 [Marasmius crinis-equi]|uniref:Uncharacterized protein n=1 Tax=Marasmius crinis-equi TaxID=585013 RepID=A0ABR3FHM9_9AGAR
MRDPYNEKLAVFSSNLAFGPPLGGRWLSWFKKECLEDSVILAILFHLDADLEEKMGIAACCVDRVGLIHWVRVTVRADIVRLERADENLCGCVETYLEVSPEWSEQVLLGLDAWRQACHDRDRPRPGDPVSRPRTPSPPRSRLFFQEDVVSANVGSSRVDNPAGRRRSDELRGRQSDYEADAAPSSGVGPHRSVKKRVCRTARIKCPGRPRLPKRGPIGEPQEEVGYSADDEKFGRGNK